jgi:predicted RNA-binding Zn-ribbon protein involved in translation (DUF1610 family)
MGRPRLEVADVFRQYGEAYRHQYASSMSVEQRRVMRAIELCRTAALGGHVQRCDRCGHEVTAYNSCRNRHCPKCQNLDKALWREARRREVLPVEYYHAVFTVPARLAPLALQNKRILYDILFRAVSQTLLCIGADAKHLRAQLGFVAVLHTWGQTLHHHPHVHCAIPGGGLSPDGKRWIACKRRFFLPVRVLSRLFRRRFLEALERAFQRGLLEFHGAIQTLAQPQNFSDLLKACRKTEWVVYAKPPFAGPDAVLDYFARYTHRIAISNHRLLHMKNDTVSFAYKDYKSGANKTMTLDAGEFIRRFLLHVLPSGFQRIRYYGFLANCHRTQKLALCRQLLNTHQPHEVPQAETPDRWALLQVLTGIDPFQCPRCRQGRLKRLQTLPPQKASRPPPRTYRGPPP